MASALHLENQLLFSLAQRTGRVVDLAYSALVHQLGITDRFFPKASLLPEGGETCTPCCDDLARREGSGGVFSRPQ